RLDRTGALIPSALAVSSSRKLRRASRSCGMPGPGGYWLWPSRIAATAASRRCSGPSTSGKPCPRLAAPVRVASSDISAKVVGATAPDGESRPAARATSIQRSVRMRTILPPWRAEPGKPGGVTPRRSTARGGRELLHSARRELVLEQLVRHGGGDRDRVDIELRELTHHVGGPDARSKDPGRGPVQDPLHHGDLRQPASAGIGHPADVRRDPPCSSGARQQRLPGVVDGGDEHGDAGPGQRAGGCEAGAGRGDLGDDVLPEGGDLPSLLDEAVDARARGLDEHLSGAERGEGADQLAHVLLRETRAAEDERIGGDSGEESRADEGGERRDVRAVEVELHASFPCSVPANSARARYRSCTAWPSCARG